MLDSNDTTDQVENKDDTFRIKSVKEKFGGNVDEIAKAKSYADEFIDQLKRENEQLRINNKKLEEFVTANAGSANKESTKNGESQESTSHSTSGISGDTVTKLIDERLEAVAQTNEATANANKAFEQLVSIYGSPEKVKVAMATLTGNKQHLKDFYKGLAKKDPEEFIATVKSRVPVESVKTNAPAAGETKPAGQDRSLNLPITMTELKKIKKEKGIDHFLKAITTKEYLEAVDKCAKAGVDFSKT
jgi:hypothetical protein